MLVRIAPIPEPLAPQLHHLETLPQPQHMGRAVRTGSSAALLQGADCIWSRAWKSSSPSTAGNNSDLSRKPSGKASIVGSLTC